MSSSNFLGKVGVAVEDLAAIIKFSDSKYNQDNSLKGRERKDILSLGSTFVFYDVLHWIEEIESRRKKWQKALERDLTLTTYSTFKDTKIGKLVYKRKEE